MKSIIKVCTGVASVAICMLTFGVASRVVTEIIEYPASGSKDYLSWGIPTLIALGLASMLVWKRACDTMQYIAWNFEYTARRFEAWGEGRRF